MAEDLPERLRAIRNELGLTQAFVSEKTGIRRSALSEIENGSRKVSARELASLSHLYGTSVDYLVSGVTKSSDRIQALARATGDMSEEDLDEVLRFAQFLRTRSPRTK